MTPLEVLVVGCAGVTVGAVLWATLRPPRRLRRRVRPYAAAARTRLLRPADVKGQARVRWGEGTMRELLAPVYEGVVRGFTQLMTSGSDVSVLEHRIRQAGLYPGLSGPERVREFRFGSLARIAGLTAGGAGLGWLVGGARGLVVATVGGCLVGVLTSRSRLDAAITKRRERMRAELYTLNQVVAMRARAGGGVAEALGFVAGRSRGAVASEMVEVLRLHRSGVAMQAALEQAAASTPEPEVQRMYSMTAKAQETGVDLGSVLLALSKDLRASRREDLQRQAARRRLVMILPIVVVLAPITLLFVAAPVPTLLFGGS